MSVVEFVDPVVSVSRGPVSADSSCVRSVGRDGGGGAVEWRSVEGEEGGGWLREEDAGRQLSIARDRGAPRHSASSGP